MVPFRTILLLAAGMGLSALALVAANDFDRNGASAWNGLSIEVVGEHLDDGWPVAVVRVTNGSTRTYTYTGNGDQSPALASSRVWAGSDWEVDHPFLFCGTGLVDCELPPGGWIQFDHGLKVDDSWTPDATPPFRARLQCVGLTLYPRDKTLFGGERDSVQLWSEPIRP